MNESIWYQWIGSWRSFATSGGLAFFGETFGTGVLGTGLEGGTRSSVGFSETCGGKSWISVESRTSGLRLRFG